MFMCVYHWELVPLELQEQVRLYYRLRQFQRLRTDGQVIAAYVNATRIAAQAIGAVWEAEQARRIPLTPAGE